MKTIPSASVPSPSSPGLFDPQPGVGPIPNDEDIASDLVDIGRDIAEGELRDAVTERYVDAAISGEETDEALDDIARAEAAADLAEEAGHEGEAISPEVSLEG